VTDQNLPVPKLLSVEVSILYSGINWSVSFVFIILLERKIKLLVCVNAHGNVQGASR
jgi:hypothetical protein